MSENFRHHYRDAKVAIYERIKGETGPAFLGLIEPVDQNHIRFSGPTASAVHKVAREWMIQTAEKEEAKVRKRAEFGQRRREEAAARRASKQEQGSETE